MMRWIGFTKKTVAVLLCISTLSVILILNNQLRSSPRHRSRYETRHALSIPLTIDLSKNVTYINLPDANNELHRYKLERVQDGEQGAEEGRKVINDDDNDYDLEEEFGDRLDENFQDVKEVMHEELKPVDAAKPGNPQAGSVQGIKVQNVSTVVGESSYKTSYLLRVDDPRYPRMIGKILSKLPSDVSKEMSLNIRMAEAKSGLEFQKIPSRKQWEVILKVFSRNGYEQRFPDVINIGVKKSGTNAMGFFLPQHPQIAHTIGNEVHFFDWLYSKGLDYYKSRMGFAKPDQLSFEKTPRYFVTSSAPGRIKKDLPKMPKFILCVRDPIARLISDFRHESELKIRKEIKRNRLKFSARTGEFEGHRLKQEILDSRGQVNASNELVLTSLYIKHYKNWLKYYSASQIMVVDQEHLEKDTYREMKRLEQFLGLRPFFKPSMFYFDQERKGICMRTSRLGPRNCPAKSTPGVLPKAIIDPETLQKLKEFYQPFNKEFSEITNMEFSWAN